MFREGRERRRATGREKAKEGYKKFGFDPEDQNQEGVP